MKLTSSSVNYDSVTQIFSFNVNVKNLLSLTIGTTTGVDTVGVKAFYESGPSATSYRSPGDTGTVSVNNADGYANFTSAHQPYHFYRRILAPSATTPNQRWELHCPPTVSTFAFVLRVFTRTQASPGVGDTVPRHQYISEDSLQALYAPSKLIYGHPRGSGPYPRAVLFVAFRQEASADERQAAIDLVGGSLILGDGVFYHLVVQDDGTANPLWQAIDRLRALPQVEFAGPDWTLGIGPSFRVPNDGPGWRKADWQLVPDSAAGPNWAAESIVAPFAWGCESDGLNATGAIIDVDSVHMEWVGSIFNNRGNDNSQITGMAWGGSVARSNSLRNTAAHFGETFQRDIEAAVRTADVINLSIGKTYQNSAHQERLPNLSTTDTIGRMTDSLEAHLAAEGLRQIITRLEQNTTNRPLYVIAAGNYQTDARLSGFPELHGAFGGRVLVVGAASPEMVAPGQRRFWANSGNPVERGSNTGTLVDIVAPGDRVVTWNGHATATVLGTSFAAPHVSGVALLLKSFDPRLTSAQIASLILDGARTGGTVSGGLPYLNAYQSLRLAAQRPNAPLCGNRVWAEGDGRVFAERVPGGSPEMLATLNRRVARLNPAHGGNYLGFSTVVRTLMEMPNGDSTSIDSVSEGQLARVAPVGGTPYWTPVAFSATSEPLPAGATLSTAGFSHGRDTLAFAFPESRWSLRYPPAAGDTTLELLQLELMDSTTVPIHTLVTIKSELLGAPRPRQAHCDSAGSNCAAVMASFPPAELRLTAVTAYAPRGHYALVAWTRYSATIETSMENIPFPDTFWEPVDTYHWKPVQTDIYRINLPALTSVLVRTIQDSTVFWMGISERGDETVLAIGRDSMKEVYRAVGMEIWSQRDSTLSCAIEYRDTLLASSRKRIATPDACPRVGLVPQDGIGGGSIAPLRAPESPQRPIPMNRRPARRPQRKPGDHHADAPVPAAADRRARVRPRRVGG